MGRPIDYQIAAFNYLDYLPLAIRSKGDFKYSEVNQITARYAGKTAAGCIALVKCIVEARRANLPLVIYQFRMRHKDIDKLWNENLTWLNHYQIPYFTRKSEGLIQALSTKIYIKGAYVSNSNQVALVGTEGAYVSHAIVIFEEAFEFDERTIAALKEAVRGSKYKTILYRTNPWLAANWYIRTRHAQVPLDEKCMLEGSGNQFQVVGKKVYHYARWTINPNLQQPEIDQLEDLRVNNPLRAKTVYYGLPGAYEGMVFADSMHKIATNFAFQRWEEFTAGIDVGHVSSATAAGLWALEPTRFWKVAEYYHSNKEQRFLEAIDLAQAILTFYTTQKEQFKFSYLTAYVDSADPGFISLLNTEAIRQNKLWFQAKACSKIPINHRVSWYNYTINRGMVGIHSSCTHTLSELRMLAYDEKAEDDKVKLVKQDDHTWDSDMYALTPYMWRYRNYVV